MTSTPDAVDPAGEAEVVDTGKAAHVDTGAAPSKRMELTFSVLALTLGLAMLLSARAMRVRNETGGMDPRSWPTMIAFGILLSAGWTLFNAVTGRRAERDVDGATRSGWIQLGVVIAMIVLVLVLWQVGLSFLILAPVFIIVCNLAFGLRGVVPLLVFPAVLTALLYLVFQLLLKVPL